MSQPATAHPHLCLYLVKVCGLALLCLTSLCLPLPARAGQWTVSYSQGQTDSYLQFDYQHPATPTFIQHAWQPPPVSGADADAYWWYIGYRWYESENLDLAGSDAVLATITWQPDGGKTLLTDPPPAKLTLIETAHSWWGATWNGSGPPTAADGQASDGLGDPMVFTVSPNSSNGFGTSSGRHLIQVDGSSGVVKIPCILSAQNPTSAWVPSSYDPDYTPSYWSWSPNSIEYTFNVVQDTRAVTISASVDVTNMKTTLLITPDAVSVDVNGDENYLPTPNQRGLDGTMYGDTIYSYNTHQDGSLYNPPNTNWITFQPNFKGNWHWKAAQDHLGDTVLAPNVVNPNTWSWSPNESQDNWDYGLGSMPMATNYALINGYPKGQDAPTTYPVVYTATDNSDSATASARYVMTLHDPYEKNFPDHTQDMTDDANEKQLGTYGPQAPFDGSTISASVTTENPWSVKVKASGEIPLPWIGGALGVDVEKSVTDDDKIGASCSDNHTHAGDYSYVEAVDHYIYHHGKVDTWGVNGYKGTQPYEVWEVGTPAHFLRLHKPYGNATAGPSPPP